MRATVDHSRGIPKGEPLAVGASEAARLLGVSERTLWTLTTRGEVPHVRIGKRVVFPVAELREWLAERAGGGVQADHV